MNHRTPPRLNVCFDPMTRCRMAPGPLTTPCPCSWSRCGAGASSWSPTQAPDQWIQQHHPRPPAVSRPPGCRVPAFQPVTAPCWTRLGLPDLLGPGMLYSSCLSSHGSDVHCVLWSVVLCGDGRCGGCRGGEWTDNQLSASTASSSRGWAGCSCPGPQPAPPLRALRDTPASCSRSFGQTKLRN